MPVHITSSFDLLFMHQGNQSKPAFSNIFESCENTVIYTEMHFDYLVRRGIIYRPNLAYYPRQILIEIKNLLLNLLTF